MPISVCPRKQCRTQRCTHRLRGTSTLLAAVVLAVVCGLSSTAVTLAAEGTPTTRRAPEQLERSDAEGVRFTLADLETRWIERELLRGDRAGSDSGDGPLVLHEPTVAGFVNAGAAARPRLPRKGAWLVVPPGTRPELRVVAEEWADAGRRRLMVEETPVIARDPLTGEGFASARLLLPGEAPLGEVEIPASVLRDRDRTPTASGGPAVTLGEVGLWRGRRVVSYAIVPVQADAQGRATRQLVSGTYEIRFVPGAAKSADLNAAEGVYAARREGRGDDRFASVFLNGEQLKSLLTEAGAGEIPPAIAKAAGALEPVRARRTQLLAPEIKLPVRRTRLYRVTSQSLRDRGLLTASVQESQVRLYQRRYMAELDTCPDCSGPPWIDVEVPLHMIGNGGAFDGSDAFLFYGLRLRDDGSFVADFGEGLVTVPGSGDPFEMNNSANYYWLAFAEPPGGGWARMSTASLPVAAGTPEPRYRREEHFEEVGAFREHVPDRDIDRIYANNYFDTVGRTGLNAWSPDPAGADVELTAEMMGHNNTSKNLTYTLIDGPTETVVGQMSVFNRYSHLFQTTFAPGLLTDHDLDFEVERTTGGLIFAYLNWVEIAYDALFQAVDDELTFPGGDPLAVNDIEVTGFTTDNFGLVEITDPRNPVLVNLTAGQHILPDGGNFKLAIRVDQGPGQRRFFAKDDLLGTGVGEILTFQAERVDDPVDPTDVAGPAPDVIVISHPEFTGGLGRWIQHRQDRADGPVEFHVVEVQDLYDWYNGGLRDPWALKRFATHAINRWGSWTLVLVGDANENALELGVNSQGRPFATDWVPTHFHSQSLTGYDPELLAGDEWFATPAADDGNWPHWRFPREPLAMMPDMYVGRFPVNSRSALDAIIDKTIAVETGPSDAPWRRRAIFMADDHWSYGGYNPDDGQGFQLFWQTSEMAFTTSERDSLARFWRDNAGLVPLEADTLMLRTFIDPHAPSGSDPRPLDEYLVYAETYALPPLLSAMSEGAVIAHFQGHANPRLLCHEIWFEDSIYPGHRQDVSSLNNPGRYFVFFGLGCHIADFAQTTVAPNSSVYKEPSLGEKMLTTHNKGSVASYASSGYEFLNVNRVASEIQLRRWLYYPPTTTVRGEAAHSRWVLGELMWASEGDILASVGGFESYREYCGQYVILGDPLMVLDCGSPAVTATLTGTPDEEIEGEHDLVALDATNLRTLTLEMGDEAGIARVRVRDSDGFILADVRDPADGNEVAEVSYPLAPESHQRALATLTIPVRPFDHTIEVDVFDTADRRESDERWELRLNVGQTAEFLGDGVAIDPAAFSFPTDAWVTVDATVASAAWLDAGNVIEVVGNNFTVTDLVVDPGKDRTLDLSFRAQAPDSNDVERGVTIAIDGHETDYVLQDATSQTVEYAIADLYCFPNPISDGTRFVFRSGAPSSPGRVLIYTVSGRTVKELDFTYGGGGQDAVAWNARDNQGDEMANGVYLYRVLLDTPSGRVDSGMQRLVIMQ